MVDTSAAIYRDIAEASAASDILIRRTHAHSTAVETSESRLARQQAAIRTAVSPTQNCIAPTGGATPLLSTTTSSALGVAPSPLGIGATNANMPHPGTRQVSSGVIQTGGGTSARLGGRSAVTAPSPRHQQPPSGTAAASATVAMERSPASSPHRRVRGALTSLPPNQHQQQGPTALRAPACPATDARQLPCTPPALNSRSHRRGAAVGDATASRGIEEPPRSGRARGGDSSTVLRDAVALKRAGRGKALLDQVMQCTSASRSGIGAVGAAVNARNDVYVPGLQPHNSTRAPGRPFGRQHRRGQYRAAAVTRYQANACAIALGIDECAFEREVAVPDA